ncbi:hypothetical protein HT031_006760 [Scenedesmus sp. PABB004]|nr:hypothetical protein HT031_006760 [Scenedesmus sp. PABB004]
MAATPPAALSELRLADGDAGAPRGGAAAAGAGACAAEPPPTPAALHNPACLAAIFASYDEEADLARAGAVCRLWRGVLEADDVWRAVYRRRLPPPQPHEAVGSYRAQFRRLRGLLDLAAPAPTALKGQALCFNAATRQLVSFAARQRMLSVQAPDGSIRSELTDLDGAGTAHRPLLASSGSELVVLAAFDGALQLWDAAACRPAGVLGRHPGFITSLAASGALVASTCSAELRLWDLASRTCLFQVPIGLPMPSPMLEPHVAVCAGQELLALANCAAPAPSSAVKIYSTRPAGGSGGGGGGRPVRGGRAAPAPPPPPPGAVAVGSSAGPDASGALLLRELPVNAAADMQLLPGLLLVASAFHGRSVSVNSPHKSERPFTVVVHIWDTQRWQLTRLVSPRLWTDYPAFTMAGTPLICLTQGLLLCATLRSGATAAPPSCSVHAWVLPPAIARAGHDDDGPPSERDGGGGGGGSGLRLLSVSPSKAGGMASAAAAGGRRAPEAFGEGAMALGRAAVAAAGGAGGAGVSAANTVMLAVSDQERDAWLPILDDTQGRLTVLLTTPTQLAMATEAGQPARGRRSPALKMKAATLAVAVLLAAVALHGAQGDSITDAIKNAAGSALGGAKNATATAGNATKDGVSSFTSSITKSATDAVKGAAGTVTNAVTGGGVAGTVASAAVNQKIDAAAASLTGQKSSAGAAAGSLVLATGAAGAVLLLLL